MTLNTLIPAIRRGLGRRAIAPSRAVRGPAPDRRLPLFPLTREETRLAVIEVLG